jgi:hypothetical protein
LRAPAGNVATAAAPRDDVRVTIGAAENQDRALVVQLVRTAREQLARSTGLKAPSELHVTVHPTVDAFMRATGEPWWVSGATDHVAIDLVPMTILRQRGQVERAIRREVAHVFVDAALKQRPMWVREGAAGYFAEVDAASDASARGKCPSDAELLQPISAGAHRNALARAEACFRRQIARGRAWDQVR